jgi:hypothetical protein
VFARGREEGRMGNSPLIDRASVLQDDKCFEDCLPNNVNVVNIPHS